MHTFDASLAPDDFEALLDALDAEARAMPGPAEARRRFGICASCARFIWSWPPLCRQSCRHTRTRILYTVPHSVWTCPRGRWLSIGKPPYTTTDALDPGPQKNSSRIPLAPHENPPILPTWKGGDRKKTSSSS